MIPTRQQAKDLWEVYRLPPQKQKHSAIVAEVSRILAELVERQTHICIQKDLLYIGALLHDIDKNIPPLPGESHPDTAVRILNERGMPEVAALVKTHPLHAILDDVISPKTWEEKLLYLADKMTKYDVILVDERFRLWNEEQLPKTQQTMLDASYPKVKELEQDVLKILCLSSEEVIKICKKGILGYIRRHL
jgi:putative nucleotidyltransferase with HDIG domain